jgi:cyclophilin family peptidyl-prolyl cis-trans isomerase
VVQLYPDKAPNHVANFLKLAQAPGTEGYSGTKFHRTIPGFMIQAGDPNSRSEDVTSWGQGGLDYTIPPEPSDLSHFAGVLSMAKKPTDFESSGCQFFITTNEAHHLDGVHTVFGAVVEGMDVVQQIASGEIAKDSGDRPANPVTIESVEVLPGS